MLPLVEEREETAWQGWEILLSAQRGKYLLTSGESSSEARLGVLKKLLGDHRGSGECVFQETCLRDVVQSSGGPRVFYGGENSWPGSLAASRL